MSFTTCALCGIPWSQHATTACPPPEHMRERLAAALAALDERKAETPKAWAARLARAVR